MYAVIKTGGKQYRVAAGQKLKIEQIPADIGQEITLDQVLSVGQGEELKIGAPLVDGASVSNCSCARPSRQNQGVQDAPAQGYRRTQGHRQNSPKSVSTRFRPDTPILIQNRN